ncbi:endoflagellar motor protein [Leptospira ryugenii]|uniref:Endoflagellar motor protein n=1 Tax=Leptospira ryugenii TaxID=1917863 RepID=A0A2P2E2T1_9LEPT|nr:flagellar motor protein MotB [Leptospira ryugenii]GBF51205.1 endoflagellar motor protein [Leptospira ryugenii]
MIRRRRFPKSSIESEELHSQERWLLTYADMITLLLGLFIILYAISKVDTKRLSEVASDIKKGFGLNVSSLGLIVEGGSGVLEDDLLQEKSAIYRLWERIGYSLKALKEKAKLKLGLAETEELKLTFITSDLSKGDILGDDPDLQFVFQKLAELSQGMDIDIIVRVQIPYEAKVDKSNFQNSWDFHSHRASLIAEKMVSQYGIPKEQISVQGFAVFQKSNDGETPEKKAKDERIEILIRKREAVEK